ncbi:hypothetical protein [Streptomyces sp. NPDC055036]
MSADVPILLMSVLLKAEVCLRRMLVPQESCGPGVITWASVGAMHGTYEGTAPREIAATARSDVLLRAPVTARRGAAA